MEKNITVVDEQGNIIGTTYPKRAKGLVKKGRARYIGGNAICLVHVCPPDEILKEDNITMFDNDNNINNTNETNETIEANDNNNKDNASTIISHAKEAVKSVSEELSAFLKNEDNALDRALDSLRAAIASLKSDSKDYKVEIKIEGKDQADEEKCEDKSTETSASDTEHSESSSEKAGEFTAHKFNPFGDGMKRIFAENFDRAYYERAKEMMTAAATRMSEAAAKFGKTVGDAATFAVGKIKTAKEDESEVSVSVDYILQQMEKISSQNDSIREMFEKFSSADATQSDTGAEAFSNAADAFAKAITARENTNAKLLEMYSRMLDFLMSKSDPKVEMANKALKLLQDDSLIKEALNAIANATKETLPTLSNMYSDYIKAKWQAINDIINKLEK